jgi:phosphate-selective porin OprO and OprP
VSRPGILGVVRRDGRGFLEPGPFDSVPVFFGLLIACTARVPGQAPQPPPPPPPPPAASSQELKLPVEAKVDGYLNADSRVSLTEDGPRTFLLRRARLGVTGTAYKFIDLRYLMEFASGDASSIATVQDAYVNVRFRPELQLQLGQFKAPFAREWATSARWVDFIERPTVVDETRGDREMGAALHGFIRGELVEYWLAAFNGTRINRSDDNHAKDVLARLVVQPASGVYLGGTLTRGDENAQIGIRGRTPDWSVTFFPSDTVEGIRLRRGLEASVFHGPFSLQGEFITTSEEVLDAAEDNETRGWYAGGAWVVTGEAKPAWRTVRPLQNFDPTAGTWGAVDLEARYEGFHLDTEQGFTLKEGQTAEIEQIWLGASWFWNPNVVFRVNFIHTDFEDPVRIGSKLEDTEDSIFTRLQLLF